MNNDAGWCGSGGPWITPELSMQIVVWTEAVVEGGKPFEGVLAKPQANKGFYQDIVVLAMPAPGDDKFRTKRFESKSALDITVFFDHSPANFPDAPQDALIPRDKIVDVSAKMDAAGKLTWTPPPGKWLVIRFGHTTTGWGNQPAPESGRGLECDKFSKVAAAAHYNGLMGKDGLRLSIEAYDRAPVNEMTYAGEADEPMGEFWKVGANTDRTCTEMVSAGHVYGKKIIGAEAFTSSDGEKWQQHPATIKQLGDWAFCEGINRFVFHRYAAQPWTNVVPGMSMGPWGLHYERTQTWWEQSKAWHQYLARCQYMLQQGLFVADVLYLEAEGAGRQFSTPGGAEIASRMRGGYNYDGCPPEVVFTRLTVKDGRLVLPDGMSYRVLVMPGCETMTPRLLRKIKELVDAGATVIGGGSPPVKSSSLADMGAGDAEVKKLASELWPRLVTGKTPAQWLGERGVKPDFSASPLLRYTHRTIGDSEVYFVANPQPFDVAAVASFRVTGKLPELWCPETGRIAPALAFDEKDGVTRVPLSLEPSGSLFVVFRMPADAAKQLVSITRDGKELLPILLDEPQAFDFATGEIRQSGTYVFKSATGQQRELKVALPAPQEIAGPWQVSFDPKWGGPGRKAEGGGMKDESAPVTFEKLDDWSTRPEAGIKYYSGTAVYRINFRSQKSEVGSQQKIYLDLGKVEVMADVTLNGKALGTLWKPPYRVDVTEALKDGENKLELKVVNLLINRQIGDEQLPEDSDRNDHRALNKWPQWLEEGKPSPTGRFTFGSWRLWKKEDPLVESGLLGPVTLRTVDRMDLQK